MSIRPGLRNRRSRLLMLGIVLSSIFLYLALKDIDWHALGHTLLDVQLSGLVFCAVVIALGIVLRGWRWCLIAGSRSRMVSPFARATNLGILGNQLLPARIGEVVRVVMLHRFFKTSLSESVGSALIDRVLDVVALLLSAWLVSTLTVKNLLPQGWLLGLGLALAAVCVGLLVLRTHSFQAWLLRWSERYLNRWSLRPDSFLQTLGAMTTRLLHWRSGSQVVAVAMLVWAADYLAVLAAVWSVGLDLPMIAPLLLWIMLAAGSALPSAPAYLGVYQLAAVLALGAYDVPAYQAVAVSLVLQGMTLMVSLVAAGNELRRILLARPLPDR